MESLYLWIAFTVFILGMIALDLGIFHRTPHVINPREAMGWFAFWMSLAMLFNLGIVLLHPRGGEAGIEFLTGFLVEKALSIDNIFVFILIFGYFNVPKSDQHKVLFWGIIGAIVLRACFIIGGLALIERFHWMMYLFGAFLLATGVSMIRKKDSPYEPGENWIIRYVRRVLPVTERFEASRFFVQKNGTWMATPLLIVLITIESSDIVFAVDSIPAIFAITSDPFIVYTSNIFAMLGLRSLYFAVSGYLKMFHFLHIGFASIIMILGTKMLFSDLYEIPVSVSLAMIVVILLICVIMSLLRPRQVDLKMHFLRTEELGLIPFRRLLLIENIIDLSDLRVRDAMRHKSGVKVIQLDLPWSENWAMIKERRLSRYPVVETAEGKPCGILHIKNLALADLGKDATAQQIRAMVRPGLVVPDTLPLEDALARFQKRCEHIAIVVQENGDWIGILALEDLLEEIVGKIGDEFDSVIDGPALTLADALNPRHILLDVQATSMMTAIDSIMSSLGRTQPPFDLPQAVQALKARESMMPTYLGKGLAVPHGRLEGLTEPIIIFARSLDGIPQTTTNERAELLFLLLTPLGKPRIQARLLADIAGLMDSDYVTDRLRRAETPEDVIEAIRAGQQVVLD